MNFKIIFAVCELFSNMKLLRLIIILKIVLKLLYKNFICVSQFNFYVFSNIIEQLIDKYLIKMKQILMYLTGLEFA